MIPKWHKELSDYIDKVTTVGNFARGQASPFQAPVEFLLSLPVEFIVVGGLAVAHYSPARMTEDVDILVRSEGDAQNLKRLTSVGGVGVKVLSPESLKLKSVVVDYVFSHAVDQPSGVRTPTAEGVILLKLQRASSVDCVDIGRIIKTVGPSLPLGEILPLLTPEQQQTLAGIAKEQRLMLEDFGSLPDWYTKLVGE